MNFKKLGVAEFVGVGGAIALVASLWAPWFETTPSNPNSKIDKYTGMVTAWHAYTSLQYVLILAAVAPVVLAFIVVRGHDLSWNRGEVTTIVGVIALLLIFGNGILFGRPGEFPIDINLAWGYLVALVAALFIAAGGILRQAENPPPPEPPGV